jgi:hypothetical protein
VRASCCSTLTSSAALACRARGRQPTTIGSRPAGLELVVPDALLLDALLEQDDALEQRLGRGGQPGTYTSTGMIWSTPLVTEYESQYGPPQLARPHRDHVLGIGHCS